MGFGEEFLQFIRRFTAQANAAYLLPHLKPGLRVLDVGCGPGTISVGLSKAVEPGELHGIDMEPSQIDMARAVASSSGCENAKFSVADATSLPFEDEFFDVAHCHDVLMHIPNTQAALAEMKRVLKTGGILACREFISGSSFTHPEFGFLGKARDMFADVLAADDGHPQMGKEMKGHIVEAGFLNVRMTASFETYSDPDEIAFMHAFANQWLLSPGITEAAVKYGAATSELFDGIRAASDRWKNHPAAFSAVAYGEVIAYRP